MSGYVGPRRGRRSPAFVVGSTVLDGLGRAGLLAAGGHVGGPVVLAELLEDEREELLDV